MSMAVGEQRTRWKAAAGVQRSMVCAVFTLVQAAVQGRHTCGSKATQLGDEQRLRGQSGEVRCSCEGRAYSACRVGRQPACESQRLRRLRGLRGRGTWGGEFEGRVDVQCGPSSCDASPHPDESRVELALVGHRDSNPLLTRESGSASEVVAAGLDAAPGGARPSRTINTLHNHHHADSLRQSVLWTGLGVSACTSPRLTSEAHLSSCHLDRDSFRGPCCDICRAQPALCSS